MLVESLNTKFDSVTFNDESCALWSGCGEVIKADIDNQHAVIKFSSVPDTLEHPNIRQSLFAKARKAKSYCVERHFYQLYAPRLPYCTATPELLWADECGSENILVFKDFTTQGFHAVEGVDLEAVGNIVAWLARFHATFLWCDIEPEPEHTKLWEQGGYWHLATRPDEYEKMPKGDIKRYAVDLDNRLVSQKYRTLIHGDAKQANFAIKQNAVMGYDFQYVGKGVGLQDIMLLFTSVFSSEQQHVYEEPLLALYFSELHAALKTRYDIDIKREIESQWRGAWPIIWSDFYRFLLGWKPNHLKINNYMKRQVNVVMSELL
ncbi:phosphotransferase [Pseudoalteromonas aurantia]|uniref:Kinase n=1 Tax=Pseudoalteromonas aurantia TaxID=43654 RepID=A0A5S3VDJ9_9GAMM|nr:phosphotransferase [Pseudoalteromonas aurantia]TMO69697.1 kinase [Pseudoalteromonas aurantia]